MAMEITSDRLASFFPANFARLSCFLLLLLLGGVASDTIVQTPLGSLRGQTITVNDKVVRTFLGVPFAEPPTGKWRFMPPQPKQPWNVTKDATTLSPACIQTRDDYNKSFWGSEMWNANTPTSEDCLYVNIWTPAGANGLAVMVWLFGGGYYYGSPSLVLYDGRALAALGNVVVININYRVGPFGFMYLGHPQVPGNMGMLDQQIALRWINQNVKAFGGDPAKVTLFGESAGAASIVAHLIAPASQGLFVNGILQSGSLDNKWSMDTPEHAYDKSMQMAALVDCNRSTSVSENIECLRKAPVEKFTEQLWNIKLNFLEFPLVTVSRDNGFFSKEDAFSALRAGRLNKDVNIMIGINHDEGNFWLIYNIPKYFESKDQPQLTREQYRECIDQAFASHSLVVREAAANVYADQACEQGSPSNFYAEQINQMIGDYFFTCDSIWLSDLFAQNEYPGNVFIYYFDQPSTANPWPKWTGVMHAYEIEFAFGVPLYNTTANYTSNERSLSRKMVQYWSSFAKTGRPAISNPSKSEIWPQYTKDNRKWLYLKGGKDEIKAIDHRKETECKMWRSARDIEYQLFVQAASQYRPTTLLLLPLVLCFAVYLRN